ncbi:hypothetical protein PoHVEF18_004058 [Penicillium ochrochloron]
MNITATQRVLATPELVVTIFKHLSDDSRGKDDSEESRTAKIALTRSAQVNSMWCLEAMRHLWESQDGALWERLGRVPEHRPQFYANHSKRLEIPSLAARSLAQMNLIVQGVTFSRLQHVSLHLRGYQRNIAFPKIDTPNVQVVHIHGVYVEIPGQDRHRVMRNLACHVKVRS